MMGLKEISGQPRQQQIENIVVRAVAEREADNFSSGNEVLKRRALRRAPRIFRLRSTAPYVFAFRFRKFGVLAWIPVVQKEEREVNDADDSSDSEIRTPSKMHQNHPEYWNADG